MISQNDDEVCTTQEAARLLKLSVTTVQHLVEAGELKAWKTKGGHRRIPLAEIHSYQAALMPPAEPGRSEARGARTRVVLVEDNEMQRTVYAARIAAWALPLDLRVCENGYQALIEIAANRPDVLLADIFMDGIDGFEVIKNIVAYPDLADLNIAVLTALDAEGLRQRGELPPGVVHFCKPINFDELRGYLRACCAQAARRQQGARA